MCCLEENKIEFRSLKTDQHFEFPFSSSSLERVRLITPDRVGLETVKALRRGSGYVSVPRRFLLFGKVHQ